MPSPQVRGPAGRRGGRGVGPGDVVDVNIRPRQAGQRQRQLDAAFGGGAPPIHLARVQAARKPDPPSGEFGHASDVAVGAHQDLPAVMRRRQREQARGALVGARPDRRDVAAVAKQTGMLVAEMRQPAQPIGQRAQIGQRGADARQLVLQPAQLGGDVGGDVDRADRVGRLPQPRDGRGCGGRSVEHKAAHGGISADGGSEGQAGVVSRPSELMASARKLGSAQA